MQVFVRQGLLRIAACVVILAASAPSASAFQFEFDVLQDRQPVGNCPLNDGNVTYSFTPESEPAALPTVRAAFASWSGLANTGYFDLTYVSEVPINAPNVSPHRLIVDVRNFGVDAADVLIDCNFMRLNTQWGTGDLLYGAAVHEMGHKLGLYHSGVQDSFVGTATDYYPAMTTCLESVLEKQFLSVKQDDRAALEFFHGGADADRYGQTYISVTSNPGFENGAMDWSARSGSIISATTATAAWGAHSGYLRNPGAAAEAYQRVTFAPQQDFQSHLVFATAWTKKHTSTDVGTAQISVVERTVTYESFAPDTNPLLSCSWRDYPVGTNANRRAVVGNPVQIGFGSCVPTTSWTKCESESGYTLGSATSLYDASDLEVVIRSAMKTSGGAWSGVDVDDVQTGYYGLAVSPL